MADRVPIDEGRLHEWLDGQLDAAAGAEIERLVADDPAWADALAEARGLIAATRRITRALDDVPADVIPRIDTRPPARVPSPGRARRPRLSWWTWRNAAALVLVAGGSALVMRITRPTPLADRAPSARIAAAPAPDQVADRERRSAPSGAVALAAPERSMQAPTGAAGDVASGAAARNAPTTAARDVASGVATREAPAAMPPAAVMADAAPAAPAPAAPRALQREVASDAAALERPLVGAASGNRAERSAKMALAGRLEARIPGVGARCTQAEPVHGDASLPLAIALDTVPHPGGGFEAAIRRQRASGAAWQRATWQLVDSVTIDVGPIENRERARLSASTLVIPGRDTVAIRWGSCTARE